jgi:hypothetical protein
MDKYNDLILKRRDYIQQLRTDDRVVEFIDADAIQIPKQKKKLMLDEALVEVERDEKMELFLINKGGGDQINHKEFITWSEFLSYFEDFKPAEERYKQSHK